MTKISETAFEEIVIITLEKIAFLLMEPVPTVECPSKLPMQTRIQFEGPLSRGSAHFFADESFAKEMASGFLGVEPEDVSTEDAQGAMKEFANMIAGELVLQLGAREDEFYLGLPEIVKPGSVDLNTPEKGESLLFHFEGDEGHLSCKVNLISTSP